MVTVIAVDIVISIVMDVWSMSCFVLSLVSGDYCMIFASVTGSDFSVVSIICVIAVGDVGRVPVVIIIITAALAVSIQPLLSCVIFILICVLNIASHFIPRCKC